jgi:hypothetical protein
MAYSSFFKTTRREMTYGNKNTRVNRTRVKNDMVNNNAVNNNAVNNNAVNNDTKKNNGFRNSIMNSNPKKFSVKKVKKNSEKTFTELYQELKTLFDLKDTKMEYEKTLEHYKDIFDKYQYSEKIIDIRKRNDAKKMIINLENSLKDFQDIETRINNKVDSIKYRFLVGNKNRQLRPYYNNYIRNLNEIGAKNVRIDELKKLLQHRLKKGQTVKNRSILKRIFHGVF